MSSLKIGLQCLWCIGLLGCQKVGSDSIKTSGMYAELSVSASGDGSSHVRAALRVGGPLSNTFVDLQSGDSFSASFNGMTQTLTRTPELLGAVSFTGTFTGDTPGMPFTIALTRASDVSAPSSTTVLPAKFTVMAPAANAVISRAQAFPITWDASGSAAGELMDITLNGSCVQLLLKGSQTDNGQATVMANELKAAVGSEQSTCPVTVTVTRKHSGTVDKAYGDGGAFNGLQQVTTTISSTP